MACWISGFFFWFFALYLVYAIIVYHKLLWYFIGILLFIITIMLSTILLLIITMVLARAKRPWDRQAWGGVRKAADDVLCRGEVTIHHEDHLTVETLY